MRALLGHTGKFCKAVFYKITQSADTYPDVISKSDKNRCRDFDRTAHVDGDRVHSWDDNRTHRVALNSVGLDSYYSVGFAGGFQ
jgi:hypothetical protein